MARGAGGDRSAGAASWLKPPLGLVLWSLNVALALGRGPRQLGDPGTGWHLATGRLMLETGTLPATDIYSFTAAGRPWVNYYWLFELAGAWLDRLGGLPLYATACMLVYACVPVLVFRRMIRMGANPLVALVCGLLANTVLMVHSLARPHVLTYVFFALVLEVADDVRTGRRSAIALWWLPPLTALWCNIHGGFVAGVVLVGIFAGVAGLRWVTTGSVEDRRQVLAFGAVAAAMAIASLANPHGWRLHLDIMHHLGQDSIRHFEEFQSPDFLTPRFWLLSFEVLALAAFALAALGPRRLVWVEVALLLFFLHQALHSQRHTTLFAIVAAPIVAGAATAALAQRFPAFHQRWEVIRREQVTLRSPLLYYPALAAILLVLAVARVLHFPTTLDDLQLTRGAADFIAAHKERFARPFNTDSLGGALIYRFWPDVRVFVDDRVYVYGDDFVVNDYLAVLHGEERWREVLARWQPTAAVITRLAPSVTLFRGAPDWELQYEDEQNLVFFRSPDAPRPPTAASVPGR